MQAVGVLVASLGLTLVVCAQPSRPFYAGPFDSPRIAALKQAIEVGDRAKTIAAFWEEIRKATTPLVEPVVGEPRYSWVTFLWQAKENTANVLIFDGVALGVGGDDPAKVLMTHLPGTDVWYRTYKVRNDAAFHYFLSPNDSLAPLLSDDRGSKSQPDPLNPRRLGPMSFLELPDAPGGSLWETAPSLPRGKVEKTILHSQILNNDRDVWVYTPPGFEANGGRYPLLIVFDGPPYLNWVQVPAILDNLIAQKRIPPIAAALVSQKDREVELGCNKPFTEFLARELVPWMRKHDSATTDPSLTVVAGSSRGGLAASFAAFQHPEIFGNVLSQSGSYWWSPEQELERSWLTRQFANSPLRAVKFSMSVGLMEIDFQRDTNRHLRDVLIAKGYKVDYAEFNGNHSYVAWRRDFPERLTDLIGGVSRSFER